MTRTSLNFPVFGEPSLQTLIQMHQTTFEPLVLEVRSLAFVCCPVNQADLEVCLRIFLDTFSAKDDVSLVCLMPDEEVDETKLETLYDKLVDNETEAADLVFLTPQSLEGGPLSLLASCQVYFSPAADDLERLLAALALGLETVCFSSFMQSRLQRFSGAYLISSGDEAAFGARLRACLKTAITPHKNSLFVEVLQQDFAFLGAQQEVIFQIQSQLQNAHQQAEQGEFTAAIKACHDILGDYFPGITYRSFLKPYLEPTAEESAAFATVYAQLQTYLSRL